MASESAPVQQATPATSESFTLGEGPVWDADGERLLWVDIVAGRVYEGTLDGDRITVRVLAALDEMATVVIPSAGAPGELLIAGQERLHVRGADGTLTPGPRVVPAGTGRRINDGATDPAGRFLVGTMSLTEPTHTDVLVRLRDDGSLALLDDDLGLSNGLAWSPDGAILYSADTARNVVYARSYDVATGTVGGRAVHLSLAPLAPDGIATDAAGHLWVALWGAGEVRRFAPDGSVSGRVMVDAPHTSSVAFAGAERRRLVITTAQEGLDAGQREAAPHSGRLFGIDVDVPGLPATPWVPTAGFARTGGGYSTGSNA